MEDKMSIPPQLGAPIMARVNRGHAGLFKMGDMAKSYFWWPNMNCKIQLTAATCKECVKSGKKSKSVIPSTEVVKLHPTKERNQELPVDLLVLLPPNWGANKHTDLCRSVLYGSNNDAYHGGVYKRIHAMPRAI